MGDIEQFEVSLNEQDEIHKKTNKSKKLKKEKVKWKKYKKLLLCLGLSIIGFVLVVVCVLLFKSNNENKQIKNNLNLHKIKMPFAINIDNDANLKKRIEEGLVSFPLTNSNKIINEIYDNYTKFLFFNNLNDLNKSKWINLNEEIIVENNIGNSKNNNILYVLVSYVVEKERICISNTAEIKLKKKYHDKFKNIANLKDEKEKEKKVKNITDEIGLYVPTKIIKGGRIDITFEINEKDKEIISLYENEIFNNPNNLSNIIKNYSCEYIGGSIDFCKNKNKTKWQESLNNYNVRIISYKELYLIFDFLEEDLKYSFINKVKHIFPEGIYNGTVGNKQRNGYGKFEYNDGSIYEGNWKNGYRDGFGRNEWNNGLVYIGYWKNDLINGKGSLLLNGDLIYEGEWIDVKRNGYGISYENGEKVYDGQWKDDKRDGFGTYYEYGKKVYEGDWIDDKRNGNGESYENGKKVYDGQWKDDKKDGKGTYYENDIKIYEGEWKDNKYNGMGKLFSDTNSERWILAYFYDGKCIKVNKTSSWIPFYSSYKC